VGSVRGLCPMVAVAAAVAWPLLAAPAAPAGAADGGAHGSRPRLAQAGHVSFWECPAATTQLLVAVNTLTLHPGRSLDITFAVSNSATTACTYTAPYGEAAPATSNTLEAGPCGSVGYEIVGRHERNVWPGVRIVNCPALGFAQLGPGATVTGTGSWNQTRPDSAQRVPVGNYTLVVNRRFSFPIHIVAH
jgi:hypothetical protein